MGARGLEDHACPHRRRPVRRHLLLPRDHARLRRLACARGRRHLGRRRRGGVRPLQGSRRGHLHVLHLRARLRRQRRPSRYCRRGRHRARRHHLRRHHLHGAPHGDALGQRHLRLRGALLPQRRRVAGGLALCLRRLPARWRGVHEHVCLDGHLARAVRPQDHGRPAQPGRLPVPRDRRERHGGRQRHERRGRQRHVRQDLLRRRRA